MATVPKVIFYGTKIDTHFSPLVQASEQVHRTCSGQAAVTQQTGAMRGHRHPPWCPSLVGAPAPPREGRDWAGGSTSLEAAQCLPHWLKAAGWAEERSFAKMKNPGSNKQTLRVHGWAPGVYPFNQLLGDVPSTASDWADIQLNL